MKLSIPKALMLSVLLAVAISKANGESAASHTDRVTTASEAGVIERWSDRALARMQGWISRARNKLTGREDDSMQGCGEMMSGGMMQGSGGMGMMQGGGMMGNMHGAQPNEQWRSPNPSDR